MTPAISPVFLFSLPRCGSTLTQRVLASHEAIATTQEAWVLLPYLYSLRKYGVYAEYGHKLAVGAIEDFCMGLPNGVDDYLREIKHLALRLYGLAAGESARYFLDKTPRYDLVPEEIIRLFEEGKFVFLWRNPLAVVASMMQTWANGKWNLYKYKVDLFHGLERLIAAYEQYRDRVHAIRYEDLVTDGEGAARRLFDYLGLTFDPQVLKDFSRLQLTGRMGDPTGVKAYGTLTHEPLAKWKTTIASPLRKAWCRRYLHWIGKERLALMGYELDSLLDELDAVRSTPRLVLSDASRMAYGVAFSIFEPWITRDKLRRVRDWRRMYSHS